MVMRMWRMQTILSKGDDYVELHNVLLLTSPSPYATSLTPELLTTSAWFHKTYMW